jgi:thiol-disulfide isomerase/thioredoxin
MLLRLGIAAGAFLGIALAYWLWKRPPRLRNLDLPWLGVAGPAIVQFSTRYCAPCKAAAPHLRAAAEETDIVFAQIDIGERPEIARRYGIRTVPTIAVADAGGRVLEAWTRLPDNGEVARAARQARIRRREAHRSG